MNVDFDDGETALVPLDKPPSADETPGSWTFRDGALGLFVVYFGFAIEQVVLSARPFGDGSTSPKGTRPWFFVNLGGREGIAAEQEVLYESNLSSMLRRTKRREEKEPPTGACGHHAIATQALKSGKSSTSGQRPLHPVATMVQYRSRLVTAAREHAGTIAEAIVAQSWENRSKEQDEIGVIDIPDSDEGAGSGEIDIPDSDDGAGSGEMTTRKRALIDHFTTSVSKFSLFLCWPRLTGLSAEAKFGTEATLKLVADFAGVPYKSSTVVAAWKQQYARTAYTKAVLSYGAGISGASDGKISGREPMARSDENGLPLWFDDMTARIWSVELRVSIYTVTRGSFDVVMFTADGRASHVSLATMSPSEGDVVLLYNGTDHYDSLVYEYRRG